ncbi:hypothetical protein FHR23_001950 [Stakelama sediminis]|uniref:Uncharacterized protein n=2 Tax=Stakelama sediminis TaxID=463200 RepID=A0A840YZU6_9SPHN|nr:hypothetical protein [Stakelama sediminis]
MAVAMLLYLVVLFAVKRLLPLDDMQGPLLWIAAALPGIPVAAVFFLIVRYIVELRDEYRRLLEVRKTLVATGVTMTIASIWGTMELLAHASHLPTLYIPVIWYLAQGIGEFVNMVLERRGEAA